jgi:2-oxo-4-hydroxy-4-carboxy--5-ureidoimidazoline (OHCU) decarboxylase
VTPPQSASAAGRANVAALDAAPAGVFVAVVAPLFEGAPGFLYRLAAARPFVTWEALFERARAIAHAMPEPLQLELVDAHPRLGAPPAAVSEMSFRDQGYDRPPTEAEVDADAAAEQARVAEELDRLNHEYEATFGFRYCVFVAGRPRSELIPELAAALTRQREFELHRALDAVVDIAADRERSRERS